MVQNKPRIESCMKPYVRSIPSTMGVESEVEAMDNSQERLCHWSHVLHTRHRLNIIICGCCWTKSKVPHPTSICGQWMAQSMTHSKMHALQWVCLQMIMNGIKPWKKSVFGPQDDSCVTCLPPCWCFVRWQFPNSYGMHIGSFWAMTLRQWHVANMMIQLLPFLRMHWRIVHFMRLIRFSFTMDTTWKIFQRFPSLITSFLFMEETDWSKKS